MPDLTLPDQHAEKVRDSLLHDEATEATWHESVASLAALLALAKQGVEYEAQLAHAHNLYGTEEKGPEKPDYARLRDEVERGAYPFAADDEGILFGRAEWLEAQLDAEFGHVPVEAFAAAMAALEQAEKERDEAVAKADLLSEGYPGIAHDFENAKRAARDNEAERDRLTAALDVIANGGYGDASVKAREALASHTTQEQA